MRYNLIGLLLLFCLNATADTIDNVKTIRVSGVTDYLPLVAYIDVAEVIALDSQGQDLALSSQGATASFSGQDYPNSPPFYAIDGIYPADYPNVWIGSYDNQSHTMPELIITLKQPSTLSQVFVVSRTGYGFRANFSLSFYDESGQLLFKDAKIRSRKSQGMKTKNILEKYKPLDQNCTRYQFSTPYFDASLHQIKRIELQGVYDYTQNSASSIELSELIAKTASNIDVATAAAGASIEYVPATHSYYALSSAIDGSYPGGPFTYLDVSSTQDHRLRVTLAQPTVLTELFIAGRQGFEWRDYHHVYLYNQNNELIFKASETEPNFTDPNRYLTDNIFTLVDEEYKTSSILHTVSQQQDGSWLSDTGLVFTDQRDLLDQYPDASCGGGGVDHYQLNFKKTAISCEPLDVEIKACANSDCSELYTEEVSLTFVPDRIGEANPITFNTGKTHVNFYHPNQAQFNLSYNNASPPPQNPKRCSEDNCIVQFKNAGFIFKNESNHSQIIPTQISGKFSDIEYNAAQLSLQAVETDTTTGECKSLFNPDQNTAVKVWYGCATGQTCTDTVNLVNNNITHRLNQSPVSQLLAFNEEAKAGFKFQYPDTGRIKLMAEKEVTLGDGQQVTLTGESNSFVVKPFGLALTFPIPSEASSAHAGNAQGSLFKYTGQTFTLMAQAVQWQANEEGSNINGRPDDLEYLNDNPVAKHFLAEDLEIYYNATQPLDGVTGRLEGNLFPGISDQNGLYSTAMSELSYDNVGIINILARLKDRDYLSTGDVLDRIDQVGRFAPSHFRLVSANSYVTPACTLSGSHYTYMDQPFTLAYKVQAENHKNEILRNYKTHSNPNQVFAKAQIELLIENNQLGYYKAADKNMTLGLNNRLESAPSAEWPNDKSTGGELTAYTTQAVFSRQSSPDGPYENVDFVLTLNDPDGASLIGANENAELEEACTTSQNCNGVKINNQSISFRYGRLFLTNNYGPETEPLLIPLETRYWHRDMFSFIQNSSDHCSVYQVTGFNQLSPFNPMLSLNHSPLTINSSNVSSGSYPANYGVFANSHGQTGKFIIEYQAPSWLQWGPSLENPTAEFHFGQFRGKDRVIYRKENF